ncbi:MAG: histone-like nucleoid-structuring protein, MvaT/MvaU family [Pseudomonas sp.]|uniref:histone-like nucleoid-structuring protein, MvaT/MvaU family n=1 Tax=Pseudomonas sp. TaxID=306 RepID=UPI0033915752
MSKLAEFRALELALAQQLKALDNLKNDGALQAEIEFEEKVRALMAEYGKSLRDVVAIIDPNYRTGSAAPTSQGSRRERQLKVYKNPHTGETVETKGGNHKVLKAWKQEHGSDTVESWLK